ncbi:MAG TPA: class I SAM-dependent methyltransferase [Thiobacillus sp.]|nr:MAG: SAM-dependent methyltransferase [Hydrogenophilales bacterium 16-64-40]OZA34033.1 MAG: SAM-dependent methyltransferase [Hydrogenophilales bacterium 17-64-65]HQS83165.1 class I SAM-dependent methyltransferase [Thiobacillus sp.]HQT35262.1 class I SAM-dependent methyltransferase [Thiobacillus sp.]
MVDRRQHWEAVYRSKAAGDVSWFQPHAASSLRLIEGCADREAHIIDVGGGNSVLVDDLADAGYRNLSVLDLAESALAASRARLGERAQSVQWIAGDITRVELPVARYDVWHDRAVFHFLTDPADRAHYVEQVLTSVKPGGHVIIAAFGPGGPLQCSGLDVMRYAPDALHAEFGAPFRLLRYETEIHHTPSGQEQEFVYCYCRRT